MYQHHIEGFEAMNQFFYVSKTSEGGGKPEGQSVENKV